MLSNREFKELFLEALMTREDTRTIQKSSTQYLTRCPFCGDSNDPNKAHLYIKVDLEDNSPIVYNCFRCPAGGVLDQYTLNELGIFTEDLQTGIKKFNKNTDKIDKKRINGGIQLLNFDYKLPEPTIGPKTKYLSDRLGKEFTIDELKNMRVITSLREFCKLNNIRELTCQERFAYIFEKDFIGFLSYGNSHILFRDITNKYDIPWIKYPITERSRDNRIFYSIPNDIDIFTEDTITVNLAEGVFDILSVYSNLGYNQPNTVNIAVTGKYYEPIIYYLIDLGIVGGNVVINIFSDNDEMFNPKNKDKNNDTKEEFYINKFKWIKYLYKQVNIYYNMKYKDCGTTIENIKLRRVRL